MELGSTSVFWREGCERWLITPSMTRRNFSFGIQLRGCKKQSRGHLGVHGSGKSPSTGGRSLTHVRFGGLALVGWQLGAKGQRDLEVLVFRQARAGRNQVTHDDVLLEA